MGHHMPLFSHNIYENVRTRVIVLHAGKVLLLEPLEPGTGWCAPGGGLEPDESLAECGQREVLQETGISVRVTGVAFLREWVVPKYCAVPDETGTAFGLEVYLYAEPVTERVEPSVEQLGAPTARWIPVADIPGLPLWPKELKSWALCVASGQALRGVPSFIAQLESPDAPAPQGIKFA